MKRDEFLKVLGLSAISLTGLETFAKKVGDLRLAEERMPALFLAHGSPMNAVEDNTFTRTLHELGKTLPRPKAILMVSAHWLSKGSYVSHSVRPEMIYDMYGFPENLYKVQYPSPGSPEMARETAAVLDAFRAQTTDYGLDHGAWSVLVHLFPDASIPVFQLSIDWGRSNLHHYMIGEAIAQMRDRGVMVIGSGNITHNLGNFSWESNAPVADWAEQFDTQIKAWLDSGNSEGLIGYDKLMGNLAKMAHPTNDHYLPLLYVAGTRAQRDALSYPFEGFQNGTLSMRCVKFG